MRIAFDDQVFCMLSHGGIARYFVRLAEQLIAREQEVGIFAPLHQNHYARELPSGVVHGFALKRYPPRSVSVLRSINHVFAKVAIKHWRPNVVHETFYSRWGSAPQSCPSVITVHDMISELFRDGLPTRDNSSKLKRMAVDRADHVICVSENTRRDLMELFGTNDRKISVVHHGFDRFLANSEANEKLPAQAKPYLLYVGYRSGYKNFPAFVRAVASFKRLKMDFDILAFGGGRFSSSEMALQAELGFQPDQVKQVAGDDKLLGHLYTQAAAFVYPSLYEGFGLPPLSVC
jgi:glycosyltransferase involved in cell wall biosynthesis